MVHTVQCGEKISSVAAITACACLSSSSRVAGSTMTELCRPAKTIARACGWRVRKSSADSDAEARSAIPRIRTERARGPHRKVRAQCGLPKSWRPLGDSSLLAILKPQLSATSLTISTRASGRPSSSIVESVAARASGTPASRAYRSHCRNSSCGSSGVEVHSKFGALPTIEGTPRSSSPSVFIDLFSTKENRHGSQLCQLAAAWVNNPAVQRNFPESKDRGDFASQDALREGNGCRISPGMPDYGRFTVMVVPLLSPSGSLLALGA